MILKLIQHTIETILFIAAMIGILFPGIQIMFFNKQMRSLKLGGLIFMVSFSLMIGGIFNVKLIYYLCMAHGFYVVYKFYKSIIDFLKLIFQRKSPKKGEFIPPEKRHDNRLYLESDLGTLEIKNPMRGISISGSAGSGKSVSFFYPIIQQVVEKSWSGFIYDFKGELIEYANSVYAKSSQEIEFKVIDFKNPSKSYKVNPLSPKYITKQAVASEMATVLLNNLMPETIGKQDFFVRTSNSILSGAIWFFAKNYPALSSLPHLVSFILELPSSKIIEVLLRDKETAGMISSIKEGYDLKAEKMVASCVSTLKTAISRLNVPEVYELMSTDEVNLDLNDFEKPTLICLGNDSTLSSTYAPVISLIASCCIRKMNEPNKHPRSVVMLDECPTIYIPSLETLPATGRSAGISTILGYQDYSQLSDSYTDNKAQILISNCSNAFYGRTTNYKTAKMICDLAGKHDVEFQSTSEGTSYGEQISNSEGISTNVQQRDRVTTSDLLQFKPGQFIGMIADNEILPFFDFVRLSPLEDVSYKPVPEQARVDQKTIVEFSNEINALVGNEIPLLDMEIDDSEEKLDDKNNNPNDKLNEDDDHNDFEFDI